MSRMPSVRIGLFLVPCLLLQAEAEDKVALRTATGHYVTVAEDGTLHADRIVPGPRETLLLRTVSEGRMVLQTPEGRTLTCGPGGMVRAEAEVAEPEPFQMIRSAGNRGALRASKDWLVFDPAAATPAVTMAPPRAEHTIELYRLGEVPSLLRQELEHLVCKAVQDELGGDGYDKDRVRKKQKFVKLPAPTLRDWDRQKRYRVLSMDEEYHVHVQLAGEPEIHLVEMPYLQGYHEPADGAILFRIEATLPLDGRVRYKIPDALSASTGFRTVVSLQASGELRSDKDPQKGQVVLQTPRLLELHVAISQLDVSNDALNLLHKPLEEMINDELREKDDRIREKANRSIQKAVASQKSHAPMLEWLLRMPGK